MVVAVTSRRGTLHTWGTHTSSLLLRVKAGFSPEVGSKTLGSASTPWRVLSTDMILAADDLGATAEKAEALAVKEAMNRVAERNFMVVI